MTFVCSPLIACTAVNPRMFHPSLTVFDDLKWVDGPHRSRKNCVLVQLNQIYFRPDYVRRWKQTSRNKIIQFCLLRQDYSSVRKSWGKIKLRVFWKRTKIPRICIRYFLRNLFDFEAFFSCLELCNIFLRPWNTMIWYFPSVFCYRNQNLHYLTRCLGR